MCTAFAFLKRCRRLPLPCVLGIQRRTANLQLGWQNSQNLGADVADAVRRLKNEEGPDLLTQGSSQLLHTLFKHDLVDEIRLSIFPVVLGAGKRWFADGLFPGALKLIRTQQPRPPALGAITLLL